MPLNNEMVAALRKAVELSPDNLPLRQALGDALNSLGRYEEAEAEYRQALALSPDDLKLKTSLAKAFFLQGKISHAAVVLGLARLGRPDAIDEVHALIDEEPDNYYTHEVAGYAFYLLHDYPQAERHFLKAMQSDPSGLGCHNWLGLTYFQQGRISESRPLLEKAILLNPHQRRVHAALAAIAEGPAARK
jgi:Flp pilus assembly protein TadD